MLIMTDIFSTLPLQPCNLMFKSAFGGNMTILEKIEVTAQYGNQVHRLE